MEPASSLTFCSELEGRSSHSEALRLRSVEEEEACTTQEILDRHAGKALRRTEERYRRRRRLERKEDEREERRTGTG